MADRKNEGRNAGRFQSGIWGTTTWDFSRPGAAMILIGVDEGAARMEMVAATLLL